MTSTAGSYCLFCFHAPLDAAHRCPACDHVSLPAQRKVYWNLNPKLIALERQCKWIAFWLYPFFFASQILMPKGGDIFQAMLIVCFLPLALSIGIWKTATKLTRHEPYFRPHLVWGLSFAGLGIALLYFRPAWAFAPFLATALVIVACAFGERWKRRLTGR